MILCTALTPFKYMIPTLCPKREGKALPKYMIHMSCPKRKIWKALKEQPVLVGFFYGFQFFNCFDVFLSFLGGAHVFDGCFRPTTCHVDIQGQLLTRYRCGVPRKASFRQGLHQVGFDGSPTDSSVLAARNLAEEILEVLLGPFLHVHGGTQVSAQSLLYVEAHVTLEASMYPSFCFRLVQATQLALSKSDFRLRVGVCSHDQKQERNRTPKKLSPLYI